MKSCKCIISGKVQGVFFRQGTKQQAIKLGITGWVRNLDDGRVECLLCGDEDAVRDLCEWLHKGPPAAKVTSVEIEEIPWQAHSDFVVKR